VVRAAATPNADASPRRYTIPPEAHFAVIREARRQALEVIGVYHSHPRGAAVPSPTDAALAFSEFLFVIAALRPTPHLRAWRFDAGNFTEVGLVRT
jgi:proteasome lid subunit RPN8/RPN11